MEGVRPLPPALAKAAQEELQESPERLKADLQHLKDWLAKQPHLRARTDDQFLVAFLRGAKFSLERAKEKLDAYYTLRSALPDFFANRDPAAPAIQHIMKLGLFLPLGEDREGRRVILIRGGGYSPAGIKASDLFKANMMVLETLLLEDDALMVRGQATVLDLAGMTVAHVAHFPPALVRRAMVAYQIATHPDRESLYRAVPQEILPEEYGGQAGPVQEIADRWAEKLVSWRQHFVEDEQRFGVDESLRPGRPKTHQDLFERRQHET
ncbi:Retinol-binding protein pinta [Gryllus bimaculatus]|nr:Retinol-binding protein pinta [Gryllus bimaculatus]